ncbi:hypothetical protein [Mesorhizobium neociceri]|uniref:Uncharacterized protein n=1 Tax=Mesorhizobium neociceri TaxID=1307853 RepID=A0A838BE76_9HYPH|nr:hypothetical protein [Mesorhizobium neociceri]MBA1144785.1 hypothetical protein [Mesorhizobium neociceri]
MVTRSRSIPAPSVVDEKWPHQVALPDDICTDRNLTVIMKFCQDADIKLQIRHVQAIWPSGKYENWRLHCFVDAADAQAFLNHFSGLRFDPKRDREKGKVHGIWRRTGSYERILDLGPLSVPEILRN